MRIAIIGSGIAGLSAAWLLRNNHEVVLYERNGYVGGHTHTVSVATDDGEVGVDTGFMVFNRRNYPLLTRLFAQLGVRTQPTDMSFSVSIDGGRLEYAGSGIGTLFAQRRNLLNLRHYRMLYSILRFNREARALLDNDAAQDLSLDAFLAQGRYGTEFRDRYLLPMAAAIWSCPVETMAQFPAVSLARFFANHGLLDLRDRPQWHTVCGGSSAYARRLLASLQGRVQTGAPVTRVERHASGVRIHRQDRAADEYDAAVLACHADETLRLLESPTRQERHVLGRFSYQHNRTLLHSDPRLMPQRRRVWSSWNYLSQGHAGDAATVSVSYWMNRLQRLHQAPPLFVSLNPLREPEPHRVLAEMDYTHPVFDSGAMQAQQQLAALQGADRLWFCGSYFGYGFHEDALRSSVGVAQALGAAVPWSIPATGQNDRLPAPAPAWAAP
ncbi:MAG: FAD-dependent oxidoreductase [Gammaproteobacteria bacterium]|jgi:predicted NAD/FAD-binding protein